MYDFLSDAHEYKKCQSFPKMKVIIGGGKLRIVILVATGGEVVEKYVYDLFHLGTPVELSACKKNGERCEIVRHLLCTDLSTHFVAMALSYFSYVKSTAGTKGSECGTQCCAMGWSQQVNLSQRMRSRKVRMCSQ